jgi:hypothetical protein
VALLITERVSELVSGTLTFALENFDVALASDAVSTGLDQVQQMLAGHLVCFVINQLVGPLTSNLGRQLPTPTQDLATARGGGGWGIQFAILAAICLRSKAAVVARDLLAQACKLENLFNIMGLICHVACVSNNGAHGNAKLIYMINDVEELASNHKRYSEMVDACGVSRQIFDDLTKAFASEAVQHHTSDFLQVISKVCSKVQLSLGKLSGEAFSVCTKALDLFMAKYDTSKEAKITLESKLAAFKKALSSIVTARLTKPVGEAFDKERAKLLCDVCQVS